MVSVSPDGPDPFFPARGRAFAGLVLGGLYLAIVAGTFFPVQLLNPGLRKAGGFIWTSSRPSDAMIGGLLRTQIEHGVDLVFKIALESGINSSCPCQKSKTTGRLLIGHRHQAHLGLIHIAGEVGLGVVEVDLHGRGGNGLSPA